MYVPCDICQTVQPWASCSMNRNLMFPLRFLEDPGRMNQGFVYREIRGNFIFFFFTILNITTIVKVVHCSCISGPKKLELSEGDNAEFMWNNTCGKRIISATFGIRKGNIANPQLINVDIINRKIYFNYYMERKYKGRVGFTGDLKAGYAWFTLKNLTIDDCNWYIASISDKVTRVLPYPVHLIVKEKERKKAVIVPTTISSASNGTAKSFSTAPSTTRSIYTGAKKSRSTRNKTFSFLFILINMLIWNV